jgi:hypothetical protein
MTARGRGFGFNELPPAKAGRRPRETNKQVAATKTMQYVSFLQVNTVSAPIDSGYNILNFCKHTFEKYD